MIDISVFRDEGPVVGGRGTPLAVTNFNMKDSASYTVAYYPTAETSSAPLITPTYAGTQDLSYKVYTFFKLSGSYSWIKNVRFRVILDIPGEASDVQLLFKNTHIYEQPSSNFDPAMRLLVEKNGLVMSDPIYPMLSPVGPNVATSRQTAYNNITPLFTNYFVTQLRSNVSTAGNSATLKLKFEAHEYYTV